MARPSSASNASRLATSTTLIPAVAICRANSLPIPDEAPGAQGPNLSLSSTALIFLLRSACFELVVSSDHLVTPMYVRLLTNCDAHLLGPLQASPCGPAGSARLVSHKL